jgi:hypothetical protein
VILITSVMTMQYTNRVSHVETVFLLKKLFFSLSCSFSVYVINHFNMKFVFNTNYDCCTIPFIFLRDYSALHQRRSFSFPFSCLFLPCHVVHRRRKPLFFCFVIDYPENSIRNTTYVLAIVTLEKYFTFRFKY